MEENNEIIHSEELTERLAERARVRQKVQEFIATSDKFSITKLYEQQSPPVSEDMGF